MKMAFTDINAMTENIFYCGSPFLYVILKSKVI